MNNVNISKLDINWQDILYNFYNNSITFTELDENIIKTGIFKLIANSADNIDITKLNHLNRFNHLNNLFEIINELNSSYNQLYNCKNYTLSRCQDYYLEFITSKEELLKQWFLGIFNGISLELYEKYEKKNKSKYHRAIEILKKYHDGGISRLQALYNTFQLEVDKKLSPGFLQYCCYRPLGVIFDRDWSMPA